MPWFAKSCQKGLHLQLNICYTSLGERKSHLLRRFNATLNADEQNGCWKIQCFFQFTPRNAVSDNQIFQLNISFTRLKEPKTILKNYWASVSHYIKPEQHFQKMQFPSKLTDNVASVTRIVLHYWIAL